MSPVAATCTLTIVLATIGLTVACRHRSIRVAGPSARFPGRCVLPARAIEFFWPTPDDRIGKALAWWAVPHSGTAYAPFVIEGQGAVLDGSALVPPDAWQFAMADDIFRFQPEHKQSQQLFLDGYPLKRVASHPRRLAVAEIGTACNGHWWTVGFIFASSLGSCRKIICLTYAKLSVGITLYKVDDVLIHNLTVQGFELDGINFHDATGPCRLIDVTARNNGRSGVAIVGASTAELHSCWLGSNGLCQLFMEDYSTCDLIHTEVVGDAATKWIVGKNAKLNVDGVPVLAGGAMPLGCLDGLKLPTR